MKKQFTEFNMIYLAYIEKGLSARKAYKKTVKILRLA